MQSVQDSCFGRRSTSFVFLLWLLSICSAQAVIFYSTGDPNYNTNAPSGTLSNSGWQYEGTWNGFLGTAVSPKYFITAHHVGGSLGQAFDYRGVSYATVSVTHDPASDLSLWRVCGTFPEFAQLYTKTDEVGKSLVVTGRGTQRGAVVTTSDLLGVKTNGWQWGPYDGVIRWGENTVTNIVNGDSLFGSGLGDMLQAAFNANAGVNECHLSFGDSAGAVFLLDGSVWKLAGINYAVDGPYNTNTTGNGFEAAIFDRSGLYERDVGGLWLPASGPGSFYATRISSHVTWINSVINTGAATDPPILQSSTTVADGYADDASATVNEASKSITVALPGTSRFYRLRGCDQRTIKSIQVQTGNLVLTYQ